MDLEARKYNFIQELFGIDKESIMTALERVLKQEIEEQQEVSLFFLKNKGFIK